MPLVEEAVECACMGYQLGAGCRWSAEYELALVEQFAKAPLFHGHMPKKLDVMPPRTVKFKVQDEQWAFPLSGRYLRESGTLEGADVAADKMTNAGCSGQTRQTREEGQLEWPSRVD